MSCSQEKNTFLHAAQRVDRSTVISVRCSRLGGASQLVRYIDWHSVTRRTKSAHRRVPLMASAVLVRSLHAASDKHTICSHGERWAAERIKTTHTHTHTAKKVKVCSVPAEAGIAFIYLPAGPISLLLTTTRGLVSPRGLLVLTRIFCCRRRTFLPNVLGHSACKL